MKCLFVLILYIFFSLAFVGQCEMFVCLDFVHFFPLPAKPMRAMNTLNKYLQHNRLNYATRIGMSLKWVTAKYL